MMAPRRANVCPNVGSTLYPRLQNKICITLFSNSFILIPHVVCGLSASGTLDVLLLPHIRDMQLEGASR